MDFFRCKCCQTPAGEGQIELCQVDKNIFEKGTEVYNYIHEQYQVGLAQLNQGWYTVFWAQNSHCLPFDQHQSSPSSINFTFLKYPQCSPLYISNVWSYCSHSDRNFPEAQAEHKQTSHEEEKKTERQREKEKTHQLSIWRMTSFVPSLSFLSHLLEWTESPLFLWDDCFT